MTANIITLVAILISALLLIVTYLRRVNNRLHRENQALKKTNKQQERELINVKHRQTIARETASIDAVELDKRLHSDYRD